MHSDDTSREITKKLLMIGGAPKNITAVEMESLVDATIELNGFDHLKKELAGFTPMLPASAPARKWFIQMPPPRRMKHFAR